MVAIWKAWQVDQHRWAESLFVELGFFKKDSTGVSHEGVFGGTICQLDLIMLQDREQWVAQLWVFKFHFSSMAHVADYLFGLYNCAIFGWPPKNFNFSTDFLMAIAGNYTIHFLLYIFTKFMSKDCLVFLWSCDVMCKSLHESKQIQKKLKTN